jgi:hypothetical protein
MNKETLRKFFERIIPLQEGTRILVNAIKPPAIPDCYKRTIGYPFKGTIKQIIPIHPVMYEVLVDKKYGDNEILLLFWREEFVVLEDERKKRTKH